MKKIFKIFIHCSAVFGFFVSFGLALHMKWFFAIPTIIGLLVLGYYAYPKLKEIYNDIFNG